MSSSERMDEALRAAAKRTIGRPISEQLLARVEDGLRTLAAAIDGAVQPDAAPAAPEPEPVRELPTEPGTVILGSGGRAYTLGIDEGGNLRWRYVDTDGDWCSASRLAGIGPRDWRLAAVVPADEGADDPMFALVRIAAELARDDSAYEVRRRVQAIVRGVLGEQ